MLFQRFLVNCEEFIVDTVNKVTDAIDEGEEREEAERKTEEDSLMVDVIQKICPKTLHAEETYHKNKEVVW